MTQDEQIEDILSYYGAKPDSCSQENLVSMLREIQEALGCVPSGVVQQAAQAVGTKPSVLNQLVKLYPSLKAANYKHRIVACSGPRCGAKGGADIYKALLSVLTPDKNGLCPNGTVLLSTQNCLKHCAFGPNILIDGVMHEHMTVSTAKELAQSLMNE